MIRLDDDALTTHLEVALSLASAGIISDLQHRDRYRRSAAVSTLARYLAERMRCFEIAMDDGDEARAPHLPLFGGGRGAMR